MITAQAQDRLALEDMLSPQLEIHVPRSSTKLRYAARVVRLAETAPLLTGNPFVRPTEYWQQLIGAVDKGRIRRDEHGKGMSRAVGNRGGIEMGYGESQSFSAEEIQSHLKRIKGLRTRSLAEKQKFLRVGIDALTAKLVECPKGDVARIELWKGLLAHTAGLELKVTVGSAPELIAVTEKLDSSISDALTIQAVAEPQVFWDRIAQLLVDSDIGFSKGKSVAPILVQRIGSVMNKLAERKVRTDDSGAQYAEFVRVGVSKLSALLEQINAIDSPGEVVFNQEQIIYLSQLLGELIVYIRTGQTAFSPDLILPSIEDDDFFARMQNLRIAGEAGLTSGVRLVGQTHRQDDATGGEHKPTAVGDASARSFIQHYVDESTNKTHGVASNAATYRAGIAELDLGIQLAERAHNESWLTELLIASMEVIPRQMESVTSVPERDYLFRILILIFKRTKVAVARYFALVKPREFYDFYAQWQTDSMVGHGAPYCLSRKKDIVGQLLAEQLPEHATLAKLLRADVEVLLVGATDDQLVPMIESAIDATSSQVEKLLEKKKTESSPAVPVQQEQIDRAVALFADLVDLLTDPVLIGRRDELVAQRQVGRASWVIDKGIYAYFMKAIMKSTKMPRLLGQYMSVGGVLTDQKRKLLIPIIQVVEIHHARQSVKLTAELERMSRQTKGPKNERLSAEASAAKALGGEVTALRKDFIGRLETAPNRLLVMEQKVTSASGRLTKLNEAVTTLGSSANQADIDVKLREKQEAEKVVANLEQKQAAYIEELAAQQWTMFEVLHPVAARQTARTCDSPTGSIMAQINKEGRRSGDPIAARQVFDSLTGKGIPAHEAVMVAAQRHGFVLIDAIPERSQRLPGFVNILDGKDSMVAAMAGAANQASKLVATLDDAEGMMGLLFPQESAEIGNAFKTLSGYNFELLLGPQGFTSDGFLLSTDERLVAFGQMALVFCAYLFSYSGIGFEERKTQFLRRLATIIASEEDHPSSKLAFDILSNIVRHFYSVNDRVALIDRMVELVGSGASKRFVEDGIVFDAISLLGYNFDPTDNLAPLKSISEMREPIALAMLKIVDDYPSSQGSFNQRTLIANSLGLTEEVSPAGGQLGEVRRPTVVPARGYDSVRRLQASEVKNQGRVRDHAVIPRVLSIASWAGREEEIARAVGQRLKKEIYFTATLSEGRPFNPTRLIEAVGGVKEHVESQMQILMGGVAEAAIATTGLTHLLQTKGVEASALPSLEITDKGLQLAAAPIISGSIADTEKELVARLKDDKRTAQVIAIIDRVAGALPDSKEPITAASDLVELLKPPLPSIDLRRAFMGPEAADDVEETSLTQETDPRKGRKHKKKKRRERVDIARYATATPAAMLVGLSEYGYGNGDMQAMAAIAELYAQEAGRRAEAESLRDVALASIDLGREATLPTLNVAVKQYLAPQLALQGEFKAHIVGVILDTVDAEQAKLMSLTAWRTVVQERLQQHHLFAEELRSKLQAGFAASEYVLTSEQIEAVVTLVANHRRFLLEIAMKDLDSYRQNMRSFRELLRELQEFQAQIAAQHGRDLALWVNKAFGNDSLAQALAEYFGRQLTLAGTSISREDLYPDLSTTLLI